MNDLGWRADGIERAKAAGGIELELYTRPGFVSGKVVRRADVGDGGGGVPFDDPEAWENADPTPDEYSRRRR